MSRLIDADAVQIQIDKYAERIRRLKKGKIPKAELAVLLDCKGCVDNTPTVDAVPVVHGKWERVKMWTGFETLYCSECNYETNIGSNYCPNCGADMRGEQDG